MHLIPVNKSERHYSICKSWLEERETTKWLSSPLRFSKYLRIIHDMLIADKKNRIFFIYDAERPVGIIGLSNIDRVDKKAELWCVIGSKSDRGKNYATTANGLIKSIACKEMGLQSLHAFVAESNKGARRFLEKSGFFFAGKFRKAFFIDGSYQDFLIFDWVNPEANKH